MLATFLRVSAHFPAPSRSLKAFCVLAHKTYLTPIRFVNIEISIVPRLSNMGQFRTVHVQYMLPPDNEFLLKSGVHDVL